MPVVPNKEAGAAVGRRGKKELTWGQWTLVKNKKIVANYACFC